MSIKIGKFTIKPEVEKPLYWIHLGVIAFVVLGVLDLFVKPTCTAQHMLTLTNWLWSIPLIGLGDILAHSILNLD
jgi:hypothetical protein